MVLVIDPVVLLLCAVVVMMGLLLLLVAHCVLGCTRHPLGEVLGAGKKSAATSDSPPSGRTMTRSASCGSSPAVSVTTGTSCWSDPRDPNTFDPYEQLDADYPDSVKAPSVPRGYNTSSPRRLIPPSIWIVALFILRQLRMRQPKATSVPKV